MVYTTVEGILPPDGRIVLSDAELPKTAVRVLVTLLEADTDAGLIGRTTGARRNPVAVNRGEVWLLWGKQ